MTEIPFPILSARTARFTLGRPRNVAVAPDGSHLMFLRSRGGTDRVTCLWRYDVATTTEHLIADPRALLTASEDNLPASERARRERAREHAGGIVAYATDDAVRLAAFALSGRLFVVDVMNPDVRSFEAPGPVFDPRLDPTGRHVAYVRSGTLRVVDVTTGIDRDLIGEPDIAWGVAEFVAAEEMDRDRGYWWAPDGSAVLAARVDESQVQRWHISDPANPQAPPNVMAYPAAGTANAIVSLAVLGLDGSRVDVRWDTERFPYLVNARWRRGFPPILQVASRDQRTMQVLDVDLTTGATALVREDRDEHWLEVVVGVPDRLPDGRVLHTVDSDDTRRLAIDGVPVSPVGVQVRAVLAAHDVVLFTASTEPTEQQLWSYRPDVGCEPLTPTSGVHSGTGAGSVVVIARSSLDADGTTMTVYRDSTAVGVIASFAEPAPFAPRISISRQSERELRTALILPRDYVEGSRPLPVLMDPYGGPHAQRVLASRAAYLASQWWADQGFAVVVVDGRGTPARGPAWERAIAGNVADPVLTDQVDALHALAATNPDLDLTRVAIRGWSFGGYLAALAVLRRPDVFHAAVAGAPSVDWALYDTYYTERYLGTDTSAPAYAATSLINDAAKLSRPLMLVHGLADDNVVAAHTLRLSAALLAAGRPHTVLPLSGVTHITSQEVVAANLLELELAFIRSALGIS